MVLQPGKLIRIAIVLELYLICSVQRSGTSVERTDSWMIVEERVLEIFGLTVVSCRDPVTLMAMSFCRARGYFRISRFGGSNMSQG